MTSTNLFKPCPWGQKNKVLRDEINLVFKRLEHDSYTVSSPKINQVVSRRLQRVKDKKIFFFTKKDKSFIFLEPGITVKVHKNLMVSFYPKEKNKTNKHRIFKTQ